MKVFFFTFVHAVCSYEGNLAASRWGRGPVLLQSCSLISRYLPCGHCTDISMSQGQGIHEWVCKGGFVSVEDCYIYCILSGLKSYFRSWVMNWNMVYDDLWYLCICLFLLHFWALLIHFRWVFEKFEENLFWYIIPK